MVMAKTYGSFGKCEGPCGRKDARLHCRVNGLIYCMACYAKAILEDPHKREKHRERVRLYMRRAYATRKAEKRLQADTVGKAQRDGASEDGA